jgi:hypothetical protein
MRKLVKLLQAIRNLIRELSDEAAYERHLQVSGRIHSAQEWQSFIDRRYRRKYQNAKCC